MTGLDTLIEHGGQGLYQPLDLNIAKCRMSVAVRADYDYASAVRTGSRLKVATKYTAIARDFFATKGVHVDLIKLYGSMELAPLTEEDFVRILTETDNALTRQYAALMGTEEVAVSFTKDGIAALARIAADVNRSIENIGARRLYTVMERVFEELSFTAPDRAGEEVTVDAAFVEKNLGALARSADVSRYVL